MFQQSRERPGEQIAPLVKGPSRWRRSPGGFTLIELLVVIAIIADPGGHVVADSVEVEAASPNSTRYASNMKQWGIATTMYVGEFKNALAFRL